MNNILDSISIHDCTGCGMCMKICTASAVTMNEDVDGFLYPEIDNTLCKECGLCIRVCPLYNAK